MPFSALSKMLLLQINPSPITTWVAVASLAVALSALLYNAFFAPSRAEKKEWEKRLSKLETDDANHEARLTGFSQNLERQNDRHEERCRQIESKLGDVGAMREDMAVLKTKMEGYGESMNEIKSTIKEIFNILRKP